MTDTWQNLDTAICVTSADVGRTTVISDDEKAPGVFDFVRVTVVDQHGEDHVLLLHDDSARWLAEALSGHVA